VIDPEMVNPLVLAVPVRMTLVPFLPGNICLLVL
jgi:hypothetical protein